MSCVLVLDACDVWQSDSAFPFIGSVSVIRDVLTVAPFIEVGSRKASNGARCN